MKSRRRRWRRWDYACPRCGRQDALATEMEMELFYCFRCSLGGDLRRAQRHTRSRHLRPA